MKLTDYLAQYLVNQNVKHVFLIIGGACAHIVDSLGKTPQLKYICMQHEQAAAMAAEAYARVTENLGVAVVTSGPGATNLITGLCCAWFDSIPCIFISGQVNLNETKGNKEIRQLGFQETDIVDIVRPITKFAQMITDPQEIKYCLEKAAYVARSGRPGPVLLDIPLNVQHADIDPGTLKGFDHQEVDRPTSVARLKKQVAQTRTLLAESSRPVILAGGGIKLGRAEKSFRQLVNKLRVPVLATWSGIDILPHDHPLYCGQIGVYGARGANFAIQNSDLLISIGSRLDTRQTSGQPHTFAREAKKVVVDIDEAELNKGCVKADVGIPADAKEFIIEFLAQRPQFNKPDFTLWLKRCQDWKRKYPAVLPEYYKQKGSVNAYVFIKTLAEELNKDDIIIADEGGNLTWTIQTFEVKEGQRLFSAMGNSPMGYAFPASIGAWFAAPDRRIICIDGDGGFQVNIQELQTVVHYNVPIKIFILNNASYGIIKQFQETYFRGRYEASTKKFGYSCPDFVKVAKAYGLKTERIKSHAELRARIRGVLHTPGPVLCDVKIAEGQKMIPKLIAFQHKDGRYISKPIEDQVPFLPREEFLQNMIVKPLEEITTEKSEEIN